MQISSRLFWGKRPIGRSVANPTPCPTCALCRPRQSARTFRATEAPCGNDGTRFVSRCVITEQNPGEEGGQIADRSGIGRIHRWHGSCYVMGRGSREMARGSEARGCGHTRKRRSRREIGRGRRLPIVTRWIADPPSRETAQRLRRIPPRNEYACPVVILGSETLAQGLGARTLVR